MEDRVFDIPKDLQKRAYIKSAAQYERMFKESRDNPDQFWGKLAEEYLTWDKKWSSVFKWDDKEAIKFSWFKGGKLNASVNCLDRHLSSANKNRAAIIWEGDDPKDSKVFTYMDLYREVNKFANVLKKKGVKKGDRVAVYLPMIPELPIAMLACARIGAVHSVVFGGFSADSLKDRIQDSQCVMLITSDASYRGGRVIPLKANADKALESCPSVKTTVVVNRANQEVPMKAGRDVWWHEEMNASDIKPFCPPESMDSEDPLFILYTSGSTGKPKGVLHTTAGFLLYVAVSHKLVFDIHEEDTFWCTADIGWVTGHSYIVYGPLCNGATSVMFEGVPNYPNPARFWAIVEKYKVNVIYTAPTAIRAIAKEGDEWPKKHDLSSLRILGTVGEPINPEAWIWYHHVIGNDRCPIVDTYWQTETGGFIITPFPGAFKLKPGSATKPFFGVFCKVLREDGTECEANEGGYLVIERPWPGLMRTVYGQHERFKETYWVRFPGYYTTGDGCRVDDNGYYWLMGRLDDVINVSGHRMGTAEIESALVSHPKVAEAAVVGMPHDIKGQGIYAFVTPNTGVPKTEDLKKELVAHVRKEIGPIATPDKIQFTDALPKTRSGKIMRRILKKIASGDVKELGDTTTLADPTVVDSLVEGRQ
ncbi:MAG: acetate--CoA ligase [Deltaproteobacteria bacterium RBG_13_61_14]|nr:MAG: acetate--CoA ligase [Deltaproteobacteria bacterium RBG_13_61_14]